MSSGSASERRRLQRQVVALTRAGGALSGAPKLDDGVVGPAGELEQVAADRGDAVVVAEARRDAVDDGETRVRTVDHRRRDGAVERDHRIVVHALEHAVERQDLWPV